MMSTLALLLALFGAGLGGVCVAVSLSINARFRFFIGNSVAATLVNFILGLVALIVLLRLSTDSFLDLKQLSIQPWWIFLGGVAGSISVILSLIAIPRIGLLASTLAAVCGQLFMSVAIDYLGLLGVKKHLIGVNQILGIVLLLIVVIFMRLETRFENYYKEKE